MPIVFHIAAVTVDRQVVDTFLCQVELQSCTGKLKHKSSYIVIFIRVASNSWWLMVHGKTNWKHFLPYQVCYDVCYTTNKPKFSGLKIFTKFVSCSMAAKFLLWHFTFKLDASPRKITQNVHSLKILGYSGIPLKWTPCKDFVLYSEVSLVQGVLVDHAPLNPGARLNDCIANNFKDACWNYRSPILILMVGVISCLLSEVILYCVGSNGTKIVSALWNSRSVPWVYWNPWSYSQNCLLYRRCPWFRGVC